MTLKRRIIVTVVWFILLMSLRAVSTINPARVYDIWPPLVNPFGWGQSVMLVLLTIPAPFLLTFLLVLNFRDRQCRRWVRWAYGAPTALLALYGLLMAIVVAHGMRKTDMFEDVRARVEASRRSQALHAAMKKDDAEEVERWLTEHPSLATELNPMGGTALTTASLMGKPETVALLLRHGADPDVRDMGGKTPLHWAAAKGHAPVVSLLIGAGASTEATDRQGSTPLHGAALSGDLATVRLLVEGGVEVNAPNNYRLTPRMLAAERGHGDVSDYLISRGAQDRLMEIDREVSEAITEMGNVLGDALTLPEDESALSGETEEGTEAIEESAD